ncbi:hypothetical protein BS78_05G288800 [Paspalum vaginatum]|nr:hypothetical protein BS78_05G288800 [Paspalum vaginatum]
MSAITTYHMTVFPLSKWDIKKIDKLRRNFLWKGLEEFRGGHCLVNWLRACRKNLKVAKALEDNRWMRGMQRMNSNQEIRQFVSLWSRLSSLHLSTMEGDITWKFTADGKYTAKSAYDIQFIGSYPDFNWTKIWKSKMEPKCRFFTWLLLQRKIWTEDNIIRRGGQSDPQCPLCNARPETPVHLIANCRFSRTVWSQLALPYNLTSNSQTANHARIKDWWAAASGDERRTQVAIYAAWNIWKERCRKKYNNKLLTAAQVADLTKQDIFLFNLAKTPPAITPVIR